MARKTNCVKNGKEYYRVTATIGRNSNGKPIRKEFYGSGKKEAEAKRDEYLEGIKKGLSLDYQTMSLGKLMHTWLFDVVRVSSKPSTFERYEGIFRNYVKPAEIYGYKINDIKSIIIQRYYNQLYDSGKSSSQIKNLNKLLKSFFNYAIEEGYATKNPCSNKRVAIPEDNTLCEDDEDEDKDIQIFTREELSLIKSALVNNRIECLVLFSLGTGLRQGELLALRWHDFLDDYSMVKVQRSIKKVKIISADESKDYKILIQTPKTKKSCRIVPVPSKLKPYLEKLKTTQEEEKKKAGSSYIESDYVFTTELGNNIDSRNLRRAFQRVLKKAEVSYRKFHALRHTYATTLFEKGVPLKTVSELLGHSDISITANIYTHVMPKVKEDAAEQLNEIF